MSTTTNKSVRFRLVHVLYAVALLCESLASFGSEGFFAAVFVMCGWVLVFRSSHRIWRTLIFVVISVPALYWFLPRVYASRNSMILENCSKNLRRISLALHAYHDIFETLPPAYVVDTNGNPMHSWRVLILPYLGEQALYRSYSFSEPWDGPNNRKLHHKMPRVFSCPTHYQAGDDQTTYFAVVSPRAVWPGPVGRPFGFITDGPTANIMLVESEPRGISWLEPRDLSLEEAKHLLMSIDRGHLREDFPFIYPHGRCVAMAGFYDHNNTHFSLKLPERDAERLLNIDDSMLLSDDSYDSSDENEIDETARSSKRLNIEACLRLGVIIIFALVPVLWLSRRRENCELNREASQREQFGQA